MRRLIMLATFLLTVLIGGQSGVRAAPYCFEWEGQADCAYYTLRQCLVTKSGVGGRCYENPRIARAQFHGYRTAAPFVRPGNCTVYLGHGRWGRCR
jgi:hypothetical protein